MAPAAIASAAYLRPPVLGSMSHCNGSGPRAVADQPLQAQPTCGIGAQPLPGHLTSGSRALVLSFIASATYLSLGSISHRQDILSRALVSWLLSHRKCSLPLTLVPWPHQPSQAQPASDPDALPPSAIASAAYFVPSCFGFVSHRKCSYRSLDPSAIARAAALGP